MVRRRRIKPHRKAVTPAESSFFSILLRAAAVLLTTLITGSRPVWQGCDPSCRALRVYFANHGEAINNKTLKEYGFIMPSDLAR